LWGPRTECLSCCSAAGPTTFTAIGIPTITLEGDANGALHPEPASYAKYFTGHYEHRQLTGGIGHNLPQEAPQAFAQAVIDVDRAWDGRCASAVALTWQCSCITMSLRGNRRGMESDNALFN